jgi:hypothetical protein
MTGGPDDAGGAAAGGDPAALLRDWMTLVQTELAGLAMDREALETWQALAGVWAKGLGGHDPKGSPAAAAAPAAGGDARIQPLLDRIDALERRVAELERERSQQRGGRRKRGGAG